MSRSQGSTLKTAASRRPRGGTLRASAGMTCFFSRSSLTRCISGSSINRRRLREPTPNSRLGPASAGPNLSQKAHSIPRNFYSPTSQKAHTLATASSL
jgi:hypothetical protein